MKVPRVTLLDGHYGARLVAALLKVVLGLTALFIFIDLLTHRRTEIAEHGVPFSVVLRYYVLFIPYILYSFQVGALATLVAALLVLGNAAQNNEVTAALAGGISLRRFARMPVFVAALVSLAVFALQESAGVRANRKVQAIEQRYFSRNMEQMREGISWPRLEGGWTCHILKFNRIALTGEHVFMHNLAAGGIEQIQARRIYWDEDRRTWMIEDGRAFRFDPAQGILEESRVIRQEPAPLAESPAQLFALDQPAETKSIGQLAADIRHAARRGIPVQRPRVDWHAKFAQPALPFVMIWLAIPFALRIRRGGVAIGFGVSIAIALSYLMLFRVSMMLGHMGQLPPIVAAWLANAVFLATGLVLFHRTPT